jgi:hypothetical protein
MKRSTNSLLVWVLAGFLSASAAHAKMTHRYSFKDGAKDSVGDAHCTLKGDGAKVADGKLVLTNSPSITDGEKIAHVSFPTNVAPKEGSVTFMFWFKARDTVEFARLLDIGESIGGDGNAFIYITPKTIDGMARAAISATDVSGRIYVDNPKLDDDQMHMMTVVIDAAAKKMSVYIDGKEGSPAVELGENTLDKVKQEHVYIGRSSFSVDPGLSATIDEFRVFDHAMTAAEVTAYQKAGPEEMPRLAP